MKSPYKATVRVFKDGAVTGTMTNTGASVRDVLERALRLREGKDLPDQWAAATWDRMEINLTKGMP